MAQINPLDMVIGAGEAQRDAKAAAKHLEAAKAAEGRGERETTIAEMRRAVTADPQNGAAFFELAYRLDAVGEEDEAMAMYERIARASAGVDQRADQPCGDARGPRRLCRGRSGACGRCWRRSRITRGRGCT